MISIIYNLSIIKWKCSVPLLRAIGAKTHYFLLVFVTLNKPSVKPASLQQLVSQSVQASVLL